jgi:hypothetical protein
LGNRDFSRIAFLAVQVCVHPGAVLVVDVLRDAMGFLPLTARVVPQGAEQGRDVRRRADGY